MPHSVFLLYFTAIPSACGIAGGRVKIAGLNGVEVRCGIQPNVSTTESLYHTSTSPSPKLEWDKHCPFVCNNVGAGTKWTELWGKGTGIGLIHKRVLYKTIEIFLYIYLIHILCDGLVTCLFPAWSQLELAPGHPWPKSGESVLKMDRWMAIYFLEVGMALYIHSFIVLQTDQVIWKIFHWSLPPSLFGRIKQH